MKLHLLSPHDFVRNFSPLRKTQLKLEIADDRFLLEKFWLGKIVNRILGEYISGYKILMFDSQIENIWKEMSVRWGEISYQSLFKYLEEKFSADHLRKFEYSFLAKCLMRKDIRKEMILDIGGGLGFSTMLPILLKLEKVKVTCLDIVNYPCKSKFGVGYVKGSCIKSLLPDASFDLVTIILTFEHVGLGRYGDPLDVEGDLKTMEEVRRILKNGGHVVLTVPYGFPTVVFNLHRVYDEGRFNLLTKGFKRIIVEYSLFCKKTTQSQIEGKKVTKDIPGFYQNIIRYKRIFNSPGNIMALLKKI